MYISVDILQFCTSHHQTRVYSYSYNSPAFLHSDLQNRVTLLHSRHFSYSVYIIQCCTSHLVTIKPLHNAYKWPIAVHSGHQTIQFALQTFSYELPVCLCSDLEPIKPVLTVQRVQTLLQSNYETELYKVPLFITLQSQKTLKRFSEKAYFYQVHCSPKTDQCTE